ncbi:LOW QUALITY PROTEIN: hypothetical protein PanWU01x14_074270 [Parasponia andersonii]|uniref:Uncharacterized protein n=1 Tax=Parasponia andersonii TaxID=3476 RepID=A0A2P5DDE7_PARAD|nr:LOW QUALITY PROTEIN: hypothetical protein PanWU01x14_074270 [Parasponia andersonii]
MGQRLQHCNTSQWQSSGVKQREGRHYIPLPTSSLYYSLVDFLDLRLEITNWREVV